MINIWQEIVATKQIKKKEDFNQTLKLIAQPAWRADIVNFNTTYLMVNTQAMHCLKRGKNQYTLRQFLTFDNQLQTKNALVSNCQLTLEKLVSISIYIKFDDKIQTRASILSLLPTLIIDALKRTLPPPALILLFYITLFSGRTYSQIIKIPERTIALLRTESIMFQFSSQLESTVSLPSFLLKTVQDFYNVVFNTNRSTRTTFLLLLIAEVILSNLALLNLQPLTTDKLFLTTIITSWMKCISCTELSQLQCQNVLFTITFNLIGGMSILDIISIVIQHFATVIYICQRILYNWHKHPWISCICKLLKFLRVLCFCLLLQPVLIRIVADLYCPYCLKKL